MTTFVINPLWILFPGLLVNLAIIGLQREHWSPSRTKTATVILSGAAAFIAVLGQQEHLSATTLGGAFAGTLGVNQAAYALLLKQTKLGGWLSSVFTPTAAQAASQAGLAADVAATMVSTAPTTPDASVVPATPATPLTTP